MNILIGKLNNEIRVLKERKKRGAPIRDIKKDFDDGIKMIDNLVRKNNIEEASELATQIYNIIVIAFIKGEMSEKEFEEKKNKLAPFIKKDKNLKARKVGKYFHHDFLNKNIKKVSIL